MSKAARTSQMQGKHWSADPMTSMTQAMIPSVVSVCKMQSANVSTMLMAQSAQSLSVT
jgi:hypothetical protein